MVDLVSDVTKCTSLSVPDSKALLNIINLLIGKAVNIGRHDDIIEIDIGIGILTLNVNNNVVTYAFSPSNDLETIIINDFKAECSTFDRTVETSLARLLLHTYKDFM